MKVSHKSKVHRTRLSLKNSVGFWKLHSRLFEFINTFYAYDSTCIQMSTFLNYFKCTHAFKRSQFRLIPNACKRSQNNPELFSVIKTCPKSAPGFASIHKYSWLPLNRSQQINSLTASTNVISMQYPNTILNTKMTLPQLVGPIDVVSPEHSSGDHRVTNSKLLPQRMPALNSPKQNMHVPPKQNSHTVPLQLVYPNKARSFPRSPATNTGYFHTPFREEASSIHGVARTDTHTELKLFQTPYQHP